MSSLRFTFGRGWFDQAPPEVRQAREIHNHPGTAGVLCVHATSAIGDAPLGTSDVMFAGQSPDIDVVESTFLSLETFLTWLEESRHDVVSPIFLNLQAETFPLSPQPEAVPPHDCSERDGLRLFAGSVRRSVRNEGTMWSLCEWVMLTARREG
jgi:hypothetical protein